ncbi:hypothetical protein DICVIV_08696 [Dictyocaulus viviparus]|uniref:Uncharacterized protein n=1 Tax=Dictyocaulus viviparus TaxID=29172 RepID=A0A0D8XND8_DICVI|nr:hypothetical protein DICVIV_08696 [Dictyocaulus viviparus]
MCRSQGEGNPAEVVVDSLKYATGSLVDNQTHHEDAASEEAYSTVINDENEMDRSDGLHSWRRRADRPPARAASAAAQTLLAAELAASVETPTYSVRRANRSRSNTSEPNNIRQSRRRVAPPSQNIHEQRLENSDQMAELTVDVSDEAAIEDDLDLDSKYEVLDEELVPIRDVAGCEVVSTKTPQRLRSIRKPTRTCSRQSGCDVGEEAELTQQGLSSSLPYETSEKSEEPVSMATRSGLHGCF